MPRRNLAKREKTVCYVCGLCQSGKEGTSYQAKPPYKCANCEYLEECPDQELRELCESFERGNQNWGHISTENYYKSIAAFINGRVVKVRQRFNELMEGV